MTQKELNLRWLDHLRDYDVNPTNPTWSDEEERQVDLAEETFNNILKELGGTPSGSIEDLSTDQIFDTCSWIRLLGFDVFIDPRYAEAPLFGLIAFPKAKD